jgi:4-amino-4-deoxy-L-arabinose transferase-like glycosyltransferase
VSAAATASRARTYAPQLLTLAATLFFVWQAFPALALLWQHHARVVPFIYPLDYGEGPLLDQVLRLARFENIYSADLSQPPFTVANYPPLFVALQVPFAWLFGPAFWYGRLLAALAALVAALACGLTVFALTGRRAGGVVSAVLLLSLPYILHWSPLNRVDSLALGLSCAGLAVLARWHASPRGRVAAAILILAAIFTRQSYGLAAPLAAFVFLWRQQRLAAALRFAAVIAVAGLALLAALTLATGGGFFFNIVTANVNPFSWEPVERYTKEIAEHLAIVLAGCGLFCLAGWFRGRAWWMIAPYALGATISAITVGKSGSNVNYLFELMAAFSLACGALVAWLDARSPWLTWAPLVALALQAQSLAPWTSEDYYDRNMAKVNDQAAIAQLAAVVRSTEGPILADEYMGLLPLAGRPLIYQPFEMKQLATAKIWNDQLMVDQLDQRAFPLILLYEPKSWDSRNERWTGLELLSIAMNYERVATYAETGVYVPQKR